MGLLARVLELGAAVRGNATRMPDRRRMDTGSEVAESTSPYAHGHIITFSPYYSLSFHIFLSRLLDVVSNMCYLPATPLDFVISPVSLSLSTVCLFYWIPQNAVLFSTVLITAYMYCYMLLAAPCFEYKCTCLRINCPPRDAPTPRQ